MTQTQNPTRVTIAGRLAFPRLDKPERFQGTGDPRYSASIIVDPSSPSHKKVQEAIIAAATKQWGADKAVGAVSSLTKGNKVAYIDGDSKADVAGFAGNFIVSAHAKASAPPRLVASQGGQNVTLDRETQTIIYPGCYVNAIVEFWAQDNQYGKRINAQLAGVQFVRAGDPFGGGRPAGDDEFEVIESDSASGFDDSAF